MTHYIRDVSIGYVNLSPEAFHMWAKHYYKCKQDFKSPDRFSPVPYFLLCRSIELEIKSRHLQNKNRKEVKDKFRHNLVKAYKALDDKHKALDGKELEVLKKADKIYSSKGFEYFDPEHALKGYSNFPNLVSLDAVTKKLIQS
jgi:hypothetical protein